MQNWQSIMFAGTATLCLLGCSSSERVLPDEPSAGTGGSAASTSTGGAANNSTGGADNGATCEPDPAAVRGTNLLKNPGFEDGLTDWNNWGDANNLVIVTDAANVHSGNQAVALMGGSQDLPGLTCVEYTLSFWAKKSDSDSAWVGAGVDFVDANGEELAEMAVEIVAGDYQLRTVKKLAPPGTVSGNLWFWNDPANGPVYVDDVSVVGAGTSEPAGTGGTTGTGGNASADGGTAGTAGMAGAGGAGTDGGSAGSQ